MSAQYMRWAAGCNVCWTKYGAWFTPALTDDFLADFDHPACFGLEVRAV
jgi:hypothetical protein